MAGSARNSNQGNQQGAQQQQQQQEEARAAAGNNNRARNKQIACRLCSLSFSNSYALITHIESHILEEEMIALRRQNQQPQDNQSNSLVNSRRNLFIPIPFRPSLPSALYREAFPMPANSAAAASQKTNPSVPGSGGPNVAQQNKFSQQPNAPPQVCSLGENLVKRGRPEVDYSDPRDGTRPFFSQCDRPILEPVLPRPKYLEKGIIGEKLDLTLRLWPVMKKTP
ncbi:Zinc finger, C2H [Trema orientale]|uniref:Zinc finger, C2H n=1 Tax=Trema orientale TaxID=63057 RepID=A0A2P5FAG9_TREOI|nr:Zinc finger, C2H [Trema orientale]